MSKVFIQNGTGSTATLENAHNEKVPVYDTLQDAEADLANLEENQIIATNEMVVADTVKQQIRNMYKLDYSQVVAPSTAELFAGWVATKRGMLVGWWSTAYNSSFRTNIISINGVNVATSANNGTYSTFGTVQMPIAVGDVVTLNTQAGMENHINFVPYIEQ